MDSRVRGNRRGAGAGQSRKSGPAPPSGGGDPVEAEARQHLAQRLDQPKITQCCRDHSAPREPGQVSAAGAPGAGRGEGARAAAAAGRTRPELPSRRLSKWDGSPRSYPPRGGDGSGVVPAFPCCLSPDPALGPHRPGSRASHSLRLYQSSQMFSEPQFPSPMMGAVSLRCTRLLGGLNAVMPGQLGGA